MVSFPNRSDIIFSASSLSFFTKSSPLEIRIFFRYSSLESNFDCLDYTDKCLYTYDKQFSNPALLHHLQMQNPNRIAVLFLDFLKHLQDKYQHISYNYYKGVLSFYQAQDSVRITLLLTRPYFQTLALLTKNASLLFPSPPLELYVFAKQSNAIC